jgi:hypothetical protein
MRAKEKVMYVRVENMWFSINCMGDEKIRAVRLFLSVSVARSGLESATDRDTPPKTPGRVA